MKRCKKQIWSWVQIRTYEYAYTYIFHFLAENVVVKNTIVDDDTRNEFVLVDRTVNKKKKPETNYRSSSKNYIDCEELASEHKKVSFLPQKIYSIYNVYYGIMLRYLCPSFLSVFLK